MKFSIIIPSHDSPQTAFFLSQLFLSISNQIFKDYEIILVKEGLCGKNLNIGIKKAKGELIKIMCQDDWFAHASSLQDIAENFTGQWMITACHNNPHPFWTNKVPIGLNTLGGLSTIVMKNENPLPFDEDLRWLIDVEWYGRMNARYGPPTILDNRINVNIGLGDHQTTNLLSDEERLAEHNLINDTGYVNRF